MWFFRDIIPNQLLLTDQAFSLLCNSLWALFFSSCHTGSWFDLITLAFGLEIFKLVKSVRENDIQVFPCMIPFSLGNLVQVEIFTHDFCMSHADFEQWFLPGWKSLWILSCWYNKSSGPVMHRIRLCAIIWSICASPVFPELHTAQSYIPVIPSTTLSTCGWACFGLACFHHQNNYSLKKYMVLVGDM